MAPNMVEMHFKVPFKLDCVDDVFESSCPVLDVYSQGSTEKEAIENLVDALRAFFETCISMGTLEDVLKECGFKPGRSEENAEQADYLDVPLSLLANNHNNAANHTC